MPVPIKGLEIYRQLMMAEADSVGFGTNNAADDPTDNQLGAGGNSYWKTGGNVTVTSGGDATTAPWLQLAALFAKGEANDNLGEMGLSRGALDGLNPAANDGSNLVTRTAVGPFAKSSVFEIEGRIRIDHLHETVA